MDVKKVGQKIKKIREARDFSQRKLAYMVGKSVAFISLVEAGKRSISPEDLRSISSILDVQYNDFFDKPSVGDVVHFRSSNSDSSEVDNQKIINDFVEYAKKQS